MKKKHLAISSAQKKMAFFCAYQERSKEEIKLKLKKCNLTHSQNQIILDWLESHQFINDERFARNFSRSRFYNKGWGKEKIIFSLREKNIPENLIKKALEEEIPLEDYKKGLKELIKSKLKNLKKPYYIKLMSFLIGRGFEEALIEEILEEKFSITPFLS